MADKWDRRFLELAKHISTWSKDPSTKCGAVVVNANKHILATGYNGFPVGILDTTELLENREEKYKRVIHCEMNAILQAKCDLHNCALYVFPDLCCARCAVHVIQSGIQYVNYPLFEGKHIMAERWTKDFEVSEQLFMEAGVIVEGIEWQ